MQFSKCTALIAVIVLFGLVHPEPASAQQSGRYVLQRAGDGFIRLDTATGATAHCSLRKATWQCDSLNGDDPLRSELSRLTAENQRLKMRIQALEKNKISERQRVELPSQEEFDRIMGFMEMAIQRFMDFARSLRDVPGKDI